MRAQLYAPFKPKLEHKGEIDINDIPSEITPVSHLTGSDPTLPPLPPNGTLTRPPPSVGAKVVAMKGKDILSVWESAIVSEIVPGSQISDPYKVKFEVWSHGKLKTAVYKRLSLKHIAYANPAPVRLQVGTRIIAVYIDPENPNPMNKDFYSGIIAEPPKTMNRHR